MSEPTFAFVDLAGFTALTEAHGDEEAVAIVHAFRDRVQAALGSGDELVKVIGDAVMLRFATPLGAVRALRAVLADEDTVLLPRAGAHQGKALEVEGDYYGAAVNLASRVAAEAAGGQLLVTTAVALAAREEGAVVTHVGAVLLRNVSDPVDVYDIRVTESSEASVALDPVCHMRVPTHGDEAITLHWGARTVHFCGLPCASRYAANPEAFATD